MGRFLIVCALVVGLECLAPARGIPPTWAQETVRRSILAGTWYPADPNELRNTIKEFLDTAEVKDELPQTAELIGIVAPHAGMVYSGPVAAYAYQVLQKHPADTVVVLAPSHRTAFSGVAVYRQGPFATPLGLVPVKEDLIEALLRLCPDVRDFPQAHEKEHAVEIQLPFLQTVLSSFRLVPLVMGNPSWESCNRLAQALVTLSSSHRFLVVASTDLSHYHTEKEARHMDGRLLERLERLESRLLWDDLSSGACEACGAGPLVTLMLYAEKIGATNVRVLKYATSADVTADTARVVGYAAAAVFKNTARKHASPAGDPTVPEAPLLTQQEKAHLKDLARQTLAARLFGKAPPDILLSQLPQALQERRGAFVTLKKHGQLRGCIGQIDPQWPLAHTVSRMALAAAFQDPRFPPVTPDEWDALEIEVSVLSPLVRLVDVSQVRVGTHGLYVRKGSRSGLLLPQVPLEQGWNSEIFLRQTCRKAGLDFDAWKDPETEIYVFTAEVF